MQLKFLKEITRSLEKEYHNPRLNNPCDPIDEIVFILLSEKTDETKYLAAFRKLKGQFARWEELLDVPVSQIENVIKGAGMGKRRARLLRRLFRSIVQKFGTLDLSALRSMTPEEAEKELLDLPGMGRKAVRCVLLYCFDFPVLPVDVHTYRLAIRLGILSRRVPYEQSHAVLQRLIPDGMRRAFHVNAVAHGRARCFARNPECNGCRLARYCSHPKAMKPLPIELRPKPIVIDLFAGAGGLSLGFKQAGFQIAQAVENDSHAALTYLRNNPDVDVLGNDLRRLDPLACLRRLGLRPGDVTALIGGPPCQGFSESNRVTRTPSNPLNHLYEEFLRFADAIQPAWIVLENVAGLRTLEGGLIFNRILDGCRALGYEVRWEVPNAAEFGVPQLRRRLFILGNRLGFRVELPKPTHGDGQEPYVTVRDAISDLPQLENGASIDLLPYRTNKYQLTAYQRLRRSSSSKSTLVQGNLVSRNSAIVVRRYRYIGPGENWEAVPAKLMDNYKNISLCHTGIYHRVEWDKPAKVIGNFRKNMLIHPSQHRGLSVREAARLQSFPDCYIFLGSIGFQQQQVADAVPPLLAEAVAKSIRRIERAKEAASISKAGNSTVGEAGKLGISLNLLQNCLQVPRKISEQFRNSKARITRKITV